MKKYNRKFGGPRSAKAKKMKHVVGRVDGVLGVTVPGEESDDSQPWELKRISGSRIEKVESEDVGSDDGDDEVASERFDMLRQNAAVAHAELAQGAMASLLESFALTPEEQKKELEAVGKRKSSSKRNNKKPEALDEVRPKSFFGVADPDDDDEPDLNQVPNGRRPKGKKLKTVTANMKVSADVGVPSGSGAAGSGSAGADKLHFLRH
jgi:hypothetical protein